MASAAVAGGILVGRWLARSARGNAAPPPVDPATAKSGTPPVAPPKPPVGTDLLAEFPCQLGDVIIAASGEEAWLAGALVFSERLPTAALFVAPEAGGDRALFVRPRPSPSLTWLAPIPGGELLVGPEPPSSLEHKGDRFERTRRVPLSVKRIGTGAPDCGDQAILAEYATAAGARMVIVVAGTFSRAWRGDLLGEGTFDILPSGKSTL